MRKNPFVRVGRPPGKVATPKSPKKAAPMDGFDPAIPAKAFRCGGSVPRYHDDSRMLKRGK
jgi:hypothetical protein